MKFFLLLYILISLGTISTNCIENSIFSFSPAFIENNGQIKDQYSNPRNDVLFTSTNNDFKIILLKNSLSYELIRITKDSVQHSANGQWLMVNDKLNTIGLNNTLSNIYDTISYDIYRVDVEFVGANPSPEIIRSGKSNDYVNNLTINDGKINTITSYYFDTIIYKNIYDNIDLVYYSTSKQKKNSYSTKKTEFPEFKYDFIINPGANIEDIKIKYNGATDLEIINDEFLIKTPFGNLLESIPISYSNNDKVFVRYKLENNVLSFVSDEHDKHNTLVIDPYLIYSTYYGDVNEEIAMGVCADTNNNLILTGFTSSLNNIASSGAHQTTMRGDHDAFIVKFDTSNSRQWATYFGSLNFDTSHDIDVDKNGNIYIVGWTKSRANISTSGAYQYTFGGGEFDSYIAKFNASGNLQWSTYFGGQYDDYINDIIIDGYSNLIFTGRTSSPSNISSLVSYQPVFGGNNDAFIAKFSSSGAKLWSTYYGGSGFDVGVEVCTDIFNNIAITGYTQSSNDIASPNAHQDSLLGIWDGFVTKFTSSGQRLWGTYMGGTENDFSWGIDFDGHGNIFITGNTDSPDNIASSGTHKDTISSGGEPDVFVVKFNPSGSRAWGSYFGGRDEDYGNVGIIDPWNNFAFAGNTFSDSNIVTSEAIQSYRAGQQDAFISIFSPSGAQVWGTYFGDVGSEYGHGLIFDKKSRLILIGYTNSTANIATTGSYQEDLGGGSDAYLTKIGDPLPTDSIIIGNISGPWCADNTIAIPYTISGTFTVGNEFTAQLSNASGLFSQFYDIGSISSLDSGIIYAHLPKEVVTGDKYRIRIVSSNPKVVSPSNGINLELNELPKPLIKGDNIVCTEHYYSYVANKSSALNYSWSISGGTIENGSNSDSIYVLWQNVGPGIIKLIENNPVTSCKDSIELNVSIYEKVTAGNIFGATSACPNVEEIYYTNETSGVTNNWQAVNGVIISDSTKDSVLVKWNEATIGTLRLEQVSDTSGCNDSSSFNVEIYPLPEPFIIGDTIVKAYSTVNYRTSAVSGYSLSWTVDGGEISGLTTDNLVQVDWFGSGNGSICLHQINKNTFCEDSVKLDVNITFPSDDVIQGKNAVCSGSIEEYKAADSLFSYHWKVEGGEIDGDSTKNSVKILWGKPGVGYLHLLRERKSDKFLDSVIMNIEILTLPIVDFDGNNEVCEGIPELYFNNLQDNFLNKWTVVNGTIIGIDDKDSVFVKWGPIVSKEDSISSGTLILSHLDTLTNCFNDKIVDIIIHKKPETILSGDTLVCSGTKVNYYVKPLSGSSFLWNISGGIITGNSGDTSITVQWNDEEKGFVNVKHTGVNGCLDSATMDVLIKLSPEKPVITSKGKDLISSSDNGNQWYLSSTKIPDAISKIFTPAETGSYSVVVTGENGCESDTSAPYFFDINDVNDIDPETSGIVIFPNPANDFVNITINSDIYNYKFISLEVYNLLGQRIMFNRQCSTVNGQSETVNGEQSVSDELYIIGSHDMVNINGSNVFVLNIDNLKNGIYVIAITINENKKIYNKLVKY